MSPDLLVHETTYRKKDLASLVHRERLRVVREIFAKRVPASAASWADFGCSNGFIIETIVKTRERPFARIVGYDHKEELLALARGKSIPNAEFRLFNLNEVGDVTERFDVVTSFETLEHVASYQTAFVNLYNHLADGGVLIVTVPNEIGFIGLAKFLGRMALRRNAYPEFFSDRSKMDYAKTLITGGAVETFRKPSPGGYGPHLGFDYRRLEHFVREGFLAPGKLTVTERFFSGLKMNVVYVFGRAATRRDTGRHLAASPGNFNGPPKPSTTASR
ncbi:MAG: methyltransferase domain-containing protein [Ignavibacteriaceae bacterium]|nr:methyltransferase domain-containing protein [Ignavibacteriaceae bacterium]